MSFGSSGEGEVSLINIIAWVVSIVIFTVVISILVVSLGPLDFTGHLRHSVPTISIDIILMILFIALIIILVYVPHIITRR